MDGSQARCGANSTLRPRELSQGYTTWEGTTGAWQVAWGGVGWGAQCLKGAANPFLFGGSGQGGIGIVSVNRDNEGGAWLNRSGRQSKT